MLILYFFRIFVILHVHMATSGDFIADFKQFSSVNELLELSKKDLQTWLSQRGHHKSGNKKILANRVFRILQFGDSDSDTTDSSDCTSDNDTSIPDPKNIKEGWMPVTTSNCPPIRYEDILNYFIYAKNPVTGKRKNCNRQFRKSKKFSNEGYVGDIFINSLQEYNVSFIQAKCRPSMKQTVDSGNGKQTDHYKLYVTLIQATGRIESAVCSCKAGQSGLCSHVGGALMAINKIKNACTSTECQWQKPKALAANPSPKRVCDIKFTNTENDTQVTSSVKPHPNFYTAGPCNDPDKFLSDILKGLSSVNTSCVLYKTMCEESANISDILMLYEPEFMYVDTVDLSSNVCQTEFRQFTNNLSLDQQQIQHIEQSTRGQANNRNWQDLRTCMLTSSNFGLICKRRDTTPPDNLIKYLRKYKSAPDNIPALAWGRKTENKARQAYIQQHQKDCGCDVRMDLKGLVVSKDFPFLGASVDGLVHCVKCGTGVVEIKCPFAYKNKHPLDCAVNKDFFCTVAGDRIRLKDNHNYFYQVMGQMAVVGLDWTDFVVYTKKGCSVTRIKFDKNFWEHSMLYKLKDFYSTCFVSELFSLRVKRGKNLHQ